MPFYESKSIEIPRRLRLSGRKGAKKLDSLEMRRKYLESKIKEGGRGCSERVLSYLFNEYYALGWAIRTIISLEEKMPVEAIGFTGESEESEEEPA